MAAVPDMNVKEEPIEIDDCNINDDDNELEALRLAALQTIRPKAQSPPHEIPLISHRPNFIPPQTVQLPPQKPIYRRHQANPNLIAIVPINTTDPVTPTDPPKQNNDGKILGHQNFQQKPQQTHALQLPQNRYCSSLKPVVKETPKEVPTKFSRIDASDSESDDDDSVKSKDSSDEDDEDEIKKVETKDNKSEIACGFAALKDDDSLERLMDVMEQEFNQEAKPSRNSSKKRSKEVKAKEGKLHVKIKTEKIDVNLVDGGRNDQSLSVKIKEEVIENETVTVESVEDNCLENVSEQNALVESFLPESDSTKMKDSSVAKEYAVPHLKKSVLDSVNSSVVSPLRIRSPREVNLKCIPRNDVAAGVLHGDNKQHVYVNILSDENSLSNTDPIVQTLSVSKSIPEPAVVDVQAIQSLTPAISQYNTRSGNVIDISPHELQQNIQHNEALSMYQKSKSPRRSRSRELSQPRRSLTPISKDLSRTRYVSGRSREHSPFNRSPLSLRRKGSFSPRRSFTPRYSRSPIPYSASPSPVRRRHSDSRSPGRRRRTRSRSWSRSISYSRSRSRSRSPYYRYRSRSPFHRSLSRSPRLGNRYLSPKRRLSPRRDSLSPGREKLSVRRKFSPSRERWISPKRRSRSPFNSFRRISPLNMHIPPKRLSQSPPRKKKSLSPKRKTSPGRLTRIPISPRRSPVPFNSYSPKRIRSPVSPGCRQRRVSLSPRRKLTPVRTRNSVSPRRSRSPRGSPLRRRSDKSPIRRMSRSSISPRRGSISPRKKSLSPLPHQLRHSPVLQKEVRSSYRNNNRIQSRSPKRLSPLTRRPISPWSKAAHDVKRLSVSPRRHLGDQKRLSMSPQRPIEFHSKHRSVSPRSPKRHSPKRNPVSSMITRRSCSPSSDKQPLRKSSPLVVKRKGYTMSRRPLSPRELEKTMGNRSFVQHRSLRSRSRSRSVSPRCSGELKRSSVSPKRHLELHSKHHSGSSRSPKRHSPKRIPTSPLRRSCSPSADKQFHRKSSPLVVKRKGYPTSRRPLSPREIEKGLSKRPFGQRRPVRSQSRSKSRSLSPGKEDLIKKSRTYVSNKEHGISKPRASSQDNYSHHGYTNRRKRNFGDRNIRDRDNRRRERGTRDHSDKDKVKESKDFRERVRDSVKIRQKESEKEELQDKVSKFEEQPVDKRNVINNPVLEARRRKFESNSPIQPLNKKIRLRIKPAVEELSNDALTEDKNCDVEKPTVAVKATSRVANESERPLRIMKVESSQMVESNRSLRIMKADSSKSDVGLPSQRITRADSNKSLDKACNTDDVLDLEGDSLLLMNDEEFDLEEQIVAEPKRSKTPQFEKMRKIEPNKKERKQVKVKPLPRCSVVVDKACSPLVTRRKENEKVEMDRFAVEEDEKIKVEPTRTKEECDLRAELSRRRAERLTKAGSVHESLPKRLLQSAFNGLIGEKTRLGSKARSRKSQLQSQVQIQAPQSSQSLRKERPPEGGNRRVLLLNRPTTHKAAFKISFPKVGLEDLDSQSESEEDDDDSDDDNEEADTDDDVQKSDENIVESTIITKDRKRSDRRRLKHVPIQLRLGLTAGPCPRRKVRSRKQPSWR